MSTIGVVIPCYNQGRTVTNTVASVLGQTRRPDEVVLVNDGSTDLYTRQFLREAGWPGVTIVDIPNAGLPAARNHGIGLTRAEYLVTLDADDILEPRYLESTAAVLDDDSTVGFVTTAIRGFGEASYVWVPPPCDVVSALTRGAAHPASMFRRRVWQDVGGFDEVNPIHGIEDVDFWISAMEHGFRGQVIPEPLLRYRVSGRSMHQRNVASGAHRHAMNALLLKHRPTVERLGIELLAAKEAAFLDLWRGERDLRRRQAELESRVRELDERLAAARDALRAAGHGPIAWGDLRRLTPISPVWGVDRGLPLDRHYIHAFLERHRADITGVVLEVKDPGYTRAFGMEVVRSEVVDIDPSNPHATLIADLARADGIPADTFDCFILTQTLPFIFDTRGVLAHAYRILKPGGVLLCTVPASGRINYEDDGIDGDYWRFTEASVRRLFAEVFPLDDFTVDVQGSILSNVAFLYGLTPDELSTEELDHTDPYFPLIITARAVKPGDKSRRMPHGGVTVSHRTGAGPAGMILLYHRVPPAPDGDPAAVEGHHFREQMEYLCRACHPMSLEDLVGAIRSGVIPARAVAVTVDDGGTDTLEVVSPIASELGIPLTVFVDTDRLDQEHERWWDLVPRILLGESRIPETLSLRLQGELRQFGTATASGRRTAYDAVRDALITADLADRTNVIQRLVEWSGLELAPRRSRRALTSPEISQLARAGHEIGAHTVHHLSLTMQAPEVRVREIRENKDALERLLNKPVRSFAYPYGHQDDQCVDLVRAEGFTSAVVVDGCPVMPGADVLRLSRVEIGNVDAEAFGRFLESRSAETGWGRRLGA